MDPGQGRKRPWEESDLTESHLHLRRRRSTPLPRLPEPGQAAIAPSPNRRSRASLLLPPLETASFGRRESDHEQQLSTAPLGLRPAVAADRPNQTPQPQGHATTSQRNPLQDFSSTDPGQDPPESPPIQRDLPPFFASSAVSIAPDSAGGDVVDPIADRASCCSPSCGGSACLAIRSSLRQLVTEVLVLDARVHSKLTNTVKPAISAPEIEYINTHKALAWAIQVLRWNNLHLQEPAVTSTANTPDQTTTSTNPAFGETTLDQMKRRQDIMEGDGHPSTRNIPLTSDFMRLPPPPGMPEDRRSASQRFEQPQKPLGSPQLQPPASSSPSYMRGQSPVQASQPTHMLHTPSSLNFPGGSGLHSMSPPIASQSSAHTVHLQDLQHQISVKTLAFQTLQREYDSLLHKLERQRTKCAALEKKFEVSDIEINTLTEEKEKLLAQVAALEAHIEELQQSRDEARRQIAANGSQYMKIVEMANLLQSQSADEKRKWRAEKDELQKRIRILEEAMVTGFMPGEDGASGFVSAADEGEEQGHGLSSQSMSFHAGHTITLLRSEIVKLRARTQTLEKALQVMKEESLSIQAAAQGIVDSGKRTQEKFSSILES